MGIGVAPPTGQAPARGPREVAGLEVDLLAGGVLRDGSARVEHRRTGHRVHEDAVPIEEGVEVVVVVRRHLQVGRLVDRPAGIYLVDADRRAVGDDIRLHLPGHHDEFEAAGGPLPRFVSAVAVRSVVRLFRSMSDCAAMTGARLAAFEALEADAGLGVVRRQRVDPADPRAPGLDPAAVLVDADVEAVAALAVDGDVHPGPHLAVPADSAQVLAHGRRDETGVRVDGLYLDGDVLRVAAAVVHAYVQRQLGALAADLARGDAGFLEGQSARPDVLVGPLGERAGGSATRPTAAATSRSARTPNHASRFTFASALRSGKCFVCDNWVGIGDRVGRAYPNAPRLDCRFLSLCPDSRSWPTRSRMSTA
ncbi:hypothetical protein ACFQL4_12610 [Halosimplex aquaticum]